MQNNPDGTTTLTEGEMRSLKKLILACSDAISSLPSDGDFLGWDNYHALHMWEDKLKGETNELDWYIDEEEDEGKHKKQPKTVDAWLEAYGSKKGKR